MRNKFKGKCNLCGKEVLPKQGRFRDDTFYHKTQDFGGLRCLSCSTTTKKGLKLTEKRLTNSKSS